VSAHRHPILCLAAVWCVAAGLPAQSPTASEVQVLAPDQAALASLMALDLDVIPHEVEPGWVPVIVYGPDQLLALNQAGFQVQVIHSDLVAHILSGLAPAPEGPSVFPNGSMGGYFTFAEIVASFDALVAAHPTRIAPKTSLGTSHEGRPIWMWKISDNPLVNETEPEIYFDALAHAREPAGMMALYWFAKTILEGYATDPGYAALIDRREMFLVPCVNPDGYVYNETTNPGGGGLWRKNRRVNGLGTFGVDLNRNYAYQWGFDNAGSSPSPGSDSYRGPSAFSEPETQAILAFAQAHPFTISQSIHTSGGYHLYPFGHVANAPSPLQAAYLEWASRLSTRSGYRMGTSPEILYPSNGTAKDWWEGARGIPAITTEMGHANDGFWPPTSRILPIAIENFPTLYEWAWIGGSHVVIDSVVLHQVSGNGNPWPEAGETFDVEVVLRNVGAAGTAASVTGTAQATTPYAQLLIGSASTAGAIASRTDKSLTFRIAVATGHPRAAPLSLSVTWTFDGIARTDQARVVAGPLVSIVSDAFEAASGWTVGSPADTGAGAWTRVNPDGTVLTLLSGATTPWQSEDDHSAAGNQCWVTGNGGSSSQPGDADVDGVTTLTSPAFDLGQVLLPEARVWLWFANDDTDDALAVEVSNDDGLTWKAMSEIRGWKNTWTQHVFRLADFLLPSNKTRVRFRAADNPANSITEAAIDDFSILAYQPAITIGALAAAQPISLSLSGTPALAGSAYVIGLAPSALYGIDVGDGRVAGIDDSWLLGLVFTNPQIFVNFAGTLSAGSTASAVLSVSNPALSGYKFFAAAATFDPGPPLVPRELSGTILVTIP
jgi:hypothetical protein